MKVKVIKANKEDWYYNHIGKIFEAEKDDSTYHCYKLRPIGYIDIFNCEVIEEETIIKENNELEIYKTALELACKEHKVKSSYYIIKAKEELSKLQILPCPFCGEPAGVLKHEFFEETFTEHKGIQYKVQCEGKDIHSLSIWSTTREVAIEMWNRRM